MIWLASASPRRKTLLEWAGYRVEVHPADADETRRAGDGPIEHARRLAAVKVATAPQSVVALAADTVVHLDDEIFDKPTDRAQAIAHLHALSGRSHQVTTGFAIAASGNSRVFHATTQVSFRVLSRSEIAAYIATGEADDKAGAYGIQGRAAAFVSAVTGSWTNVVGLPLESVIPVLDGLGIARN